MASASMAWISAFKNADSSVHLKAGSEVIVIGVISIMPLILAVSGSYYLHPIINGTPVRPFFDIFGSAIFDGQLFFYAMSFIAAVVWYSAQELKSPFPLRIFFWAISFILGMSCAFFYGLSPALIGTKTIDLTWISLTVYLFSIILYFLILAFQEITPADLDRYMRKGEDKLAEGFRNRREDQK